METRSARMGAFGEFKPPSLLDKFGIWLSSRRMRRAVGSYRGLRVGDFGCGYNASFVRGVLDEVRSVVLVDFTIATDLMDHPKIEAIQGALPKSLAEIADESLDVVICNSVLEHLRKPELTLREFRRITAPGGVCLINVPSWRGKRFLEFSAFRLGTTPLEEIDEHRRYFDPRDLWPMLVDAGFRPANIKCFRHKFGLNTFAICRVKS